MRRAATVVLVFLAAAAASAAGTYKVGDDVADETLTMADGSSAKLSSHEGSALLLFFYDLTTRNAAADAKIVEAARAARAKQKFAVVGVARDAKAADAKKFAEDHKLGFPQALDAKAALYGKFATKGTPWLALLDGKRKLKHSAAGVDEETLDAALTDLLGAKDAAPPPKKDKGGPAPKKDDGGGGKK
jgi:peroxiredoxin